MKGQPTTVVTSTKNVQARDGTEELGRESAHVHKLLCRLRNVGATPYDLVVMRTADDKYFERFLASIRGAIVPSDDDLELVNLDRGFNVNDLEMEKGKGLPSMVADNLVDIRLGIRPLEIGSNDFEFGDMKIVVVKPTGMCVDKGVFTRDTLLCTSTRYLDLNLAAARWMFQSHRARSIFQREPFSDEWADETLFFLGTVWVAWNGKKKVVVAPALTSDKDGNIKKMIKVVPEGTWPANCFIATLVPL